GARGGGATPGRSRGGPPLRAPGAAYRPGRDDGGRRPGLEMLGPLRTADAPANGGQHGDEAAGGEPAQPERRGVRAEADSVRGRERTGEVGGPVDRAPGPRAYAAPEQARDDERGDQVQGQRPEADPEGAAGGDEGHEHRGQAHERVGIGERRGDVDDEEDDREEGEAAVQARGHEPRQPAGPPAPDGRDPEGHHAGEEDERDNPRRPHQIPVRLRADEGGGGDRHHEPPEVATALLLELVAVVTFLTTAFFFFFFFAAVLDAAALVGDVVA